MKTETTPYAVRETELDGFWKSGRNGGIAASRARSQRARKPKPKRSDRKEANP